MSNEKGGRTSPAFALAGEAMPDRRLRPGPSKTTNRAFYGLFIKLGASKLLERKNVAIEKKRSRTRSGKDRRRGVDTRTEEEKKLVGERRSTIDRRSGRDRRAK